MANLLFHKLDHFRAENNFFTIMKRSCLPVKTRFVRAVVEDLVANVFKLFCFIVVTSTK